MTSLIPSERIIAQIIKIFEAECGAEIRYTEVERTYKYNFNITGDYIMMPGGENLYVYLLGSHDFVLSDEGSVYKESEQLIYDENHKGIDKESRLHEVYSALGHQDYFEKPFTYENASAVFRDLISIMKKAKDIVDR